MLADGMQGNAAAHLIDAIRQQGYELVFDNPANDPMAVMHHVLWDKWTEGEVGEHQFIGRLFNERGQIYHGYTVFDAANCTLALGGEICAHIEPPVQLPSWADKPPEEAGPLLNMIERLRTQAGANIDSTLREMVAANNVNSILERQENAMDVLLASFEQPKPTALLPGSTGGDYSALETAVLALVPTNPEQLANIEQVIEAASGDPENRKLLALITERLPNHTQLARLTPWAYSSWCRSTCSKWYQRLILTISACSL